MKVSTAAVPRPPAPRRDITAATTNAEVLLFLLRAIIVGALKGARDFIALVSVVGFIFIVYALAVIAMTLRFAHGW